MNHEMEIPVDAGNLEETLLQVKRLRGKNVSPDVYRNLLVSLQGLLESNTEDLNNLVGKLNSQIAHLEEA